MLTRADLDGTHIEYSYKHPNLVTVIVEGQNGHLRAATDGQEWHLPTYDLRNETKYMYKLHTVEIYFWTKKDALQFLNGIRRVVPEQQITIQGEPLAQPPHQDEMSPIVQKLENVAITDPSYQGGKTRDSRTTSFPGPPISATPQSQEASNFVPMAYNPAAPAAPEVIKHREKTPPPEDGAANPLVAAAAVDQGQTFGIPRNGVGFSGPPGPPSQPPQQGSYFPGPPASAPAVQPPTSAAPQSPYAHHFQNSFAPPPTTASDSPYAQPPPSSAPPPPAYQSQQQAQTHIPVTQFANYPGSPGISSGMNTPGIYSPGFPPSVHGSAPGVNSPADPPGGFSQFQYNNKVSSTQPLMTDYSIHQQVYRPTESEATHGKAPKAAKTPATTKGPRGKLEDRADKLERGVGSLFKKLEKKIG